jgi:hypothetical protein
MAGAFLADPETLDGGNSDRVRPLTPLAVRLPLKHRLMTGTEGGRAAVAEA